MFICGEFSFFFCSNQCSCNARDFTNTVDVKIDCKTQNKVSTREKVREQNRICQLAKTAREKMQKDYQSFCLVAAHLVRNAHRYYSEANCKQTMKSEENKSEEKLQDVPMSDAEEICNDVHQKLCVIRSLKHQNRIKEQQDMVTKLRNIYGSYRNLKKISGHPLKTLHDWCSPPKEKIHKAKKRADLKKEEFTNFLMQDTISYSHPSTTYVGKKFLMHTWDEIFKKY